MANELSRMVKAREVIERIEMVSEETIKISDFAGRKKANFKEQKMTGLNRYSMCILSAKFGAEKMHVLINSPRS